MQIQAEAVAELRPLPLLADPGAYTPCTFPYATNISKEHPVGLRQWLDVFRHSIPTFKAHALRDASVPEQIRQAGAEQFAGEFSAALDMLREERPEPLPGHEFIPPVNCLTLCQLRDAVLHAAGFTDVFKATKDKENAAALQLLPDVTRHLDAIGDAGSRMEAALRGVFAGNLFDLGAQASAEAYERGEMSFAATREGLLPRPWAVDDLDAAVQRLAHGPPHARAVLFCDNAGADVVLGMVPLARELLKRGTEVVMAANSEPSINDITAAELEPLLAHTAIAGDAVLGPAAADGRLRVVANGSALPVIDLRRLSPQLCNEASAADLVVLEGMGRGIETNLYATFTCDALNLALIKHPEVALCLGGRLYDVVCRFQPAR